MHGLDCGAGKAQACLLLRGVPGLPWTLPGLDSGRSDEKTFAVSWVVPRVG